ncbi:MAG: sugar phosphate nucleotidyltransferase [Candidatus Undinarchaeales archaeon]|jgi:bifunctional UDP-N-acetylglucosamine pyrophosphorylase/glucosamine-1-phosphate N-acetyltransferase|nr:sugar phosphate nucleotidyltransferase [Candidatus Undinarchaeales archaeon]MDP7491608.1 sugar phosphate nucleotidyltransferase [Candidatus Undinarchaeales archaeon]
MGMKAVILAAGRGTRLHPLTATRQKSMIPLAGKPILYHVLSAVKAAQISEVVLVVNEFADEIRQYFGTGERFGLSITYVDQGKCLGTAHALHMAAENTKLNDDFLLIHGDLIFDHAVMERLHAAKGGSVVVGAHVDNPWEYGVLTCNGSHLTEVRERPPEQEAKGCMVNAGIYLLESSFLDAVAKGEAERHEYDIPHALNHYIEGGSRVEVLEHRGYYRDVGRPWELLEANEFIMKKIDHRIEGELEPGVVIKGDVVIEKGTVITGTSYIKGPVYIGKNCEIGPNCFIRDNVNISDDVRIGRAVEVKNSLILNGSKAEHLAYIGDALIGAGCNFGAGTKVANLRFDDKPINVRIKGETVSSGRRKLGAILGDGVKTGVNASIMPGVKAGPNTHIGPGVIVYRDLDPNIRIFVVQEYDITPIGEGDEEGGGTG